MKIYGEVVTFIVIFIASTVALKLLDPDNNLKKMFDSLFEDKNTKADYATYFTDADENEYLEEYY